jgi:hypothetical protein
VLQLPKAFNGQALVGGKVTSNNNEVPVLLINRDGDLPLIVNPDIETKSI